MSQSLQDLKFIALIVKSLLFNLELDEQRENAIALANQASQRADRLASKLLELGIDLDTL